MDEESVVFNLAGEKNPHGNAIAAEDWGFDGVD